MNSTVAACADVLMYCCTADLGAAVLLVLLYCHTADLAAASALMFFAAYCHGIVLWLQRLFDAWGLGDM